MQNERSAKHGANKRRRAESGDRDVLSLSPAEFAAWDRGQTLKRYVRAAAALAGLFDDTAIATAVERGRITVGKWWTGVKPEIEAIGKLADATGLSTEELTRSVYFEGPPPTLPGCALDEDQMAAQRLEADAKSRSAPVARPETHTV